jgi:hypothetical protein
MGRKGGGGLLALKMLFHFYFSREIQIKFKLQFSNSNLGKQMTFSKNGPKMKVV